MKERVYIILHSFFDGKSACFKNLPFFFFKQKGPKDPKATHLKFVGPFKGHNKTLHTNTPSFKCNLIQGIFLSLNKHI